MKRMSWALAALLLSGLLYYLFIRSFEFEVNFSAATTPGDLIETIRIWNKSLKDSNISEVDSFSTLKQSVTWENQTYVYEWYFTPAADSITNVKARISQPGRQILNKLLVPFTDQKIEQDAAAIAQNFYLALKTHLKITRVSIVGEVEIDSSFCACSTLETKQTEKAFGMMRDYPLLTSFVDENQLKGAGLPMVRVREWDHSKGRLKFDFCFPVTGQRPDSYTSEIVFRKFEKKRALKAEYFGNYITSDRAWYELLQYAGRNGYKTTGLPIEVFHNNPNLGFNERRWKAEIYLPIIE